MRIRFEYDALKNTSFQKKNSHVIINMKGNSLRSCLLTAFEMMTTLSAEEDIIEQEVNVFEERFTDEELLKRIIDHQYWFDTDEKFFIMLSIINLDTNEVIYENKKHCITLDENSCYDNEESFEEEQEIWG